MNKDRKSSTQMLFETPNAQDLLKLPCLDLDQINFLSATAGDSACEFFRDVIDAYKAECKACIEEFSTACSLQALNRIERSAHAIAGSSANLGLVRLAKLCKNIENACLSGVFNSFDASLKELNHELECAFHALEDYFLKLGK